MTKEDNELSNNKNEWNDLDTFDKKEPMGCLGQFFLGIFFIIAICIAVIWVVCSNNSLQF
jgi:flagellar biogenesis protein FliO